MSFLGVLVGSQCKFVLLFSRYPELRAARRSDEWPMTSSVVKFFIEGASGARSLSFRPFNSDSAPMGPFFMALAAPSNLFLIGLE